MPATIPRTVSADAVWGGGDSSKPRWISRSKRCEARSRWGTAGGAERQRLDRDQRRGRLLFGDHVHAACRPRRAASRAGRPARRRPRSPAGRSRGSRRRRSRRKQSCLLFEVLVEGALRDAREADQLAQRRLADSRGARPPRPSRPRAGRAGVAPPPPPPSCAARSKGGGRSVLSGRSRSESSPRRFVRTNDMA